MDIVKRRTRVVSFRVSEEEYQDLVSICLRRQARSISDFARFVTLSQSKSDGPENRPESMLQQIHSKLGLIDCEVRRLAGLIEPQPFDSVAMFQPVASSRR